MARFGVIAVMEAEHRFLFHRALSRHDDPDFAREVAKEHLRLGQILIDLIGPMSYSVTQGFVPEGGEFITAFTVWTNRAMPMPGSILKRAKELGADFETLRYNL